MKTNNKRTGWAAGSVTGAVRRRMEGGGKRLWRLEDFADMSFAAVAQALSRLTRQGVIQRVGKGLYYRPQRTTSGRSKSDNDEIQSLLRRGRKSFPAGVAAASVLGFTNRKPAWAELTAEEKDRSRGIASEDAAIYTRRPKSWRTLPETDAAILDFLRNRGEASELSSAKTVDKLLEYFREPGRFERLLKVASTEPPRVRAMLGAIGQQMGLPEGRLCTLRESLHPVTHYDFGRLAVLKHAREWRGKGGKGRETA